MTKATPVTKLSLTVVEKAPVVKLPKTAGVVPVASPSDVPPASYNVTLYGKDQQGAVSPLMVAVPEV
jgi:hypothetical protein